jgi:hypothetical protein
VLAVAVGTLDGASTGVVFGCPMVRKSLHLGTSLHPVLCM